jgi:serine/threonine-protein kinase RsbT
LPGAKWLMDEFDIASEVGRGTTIVMKKWKR